MVRLLNIPTHKLVVILWCAMGFTGAIAQDEGKTIPHGDMLSADGWFGDVSLGLKRYAEISELRPIVVILKKSAIAKDDDRLVVVSSLFDAVGSALEVPEDKLKFEVCLMKISGDQQVALEDVVGAEAAAIDSLWVAASDVVFRSTVVGGYSDPGVVRDGVDYYVFSTFRAKGEQLSFSKHMGALIKSGSKQGTKCGVLERLIEKVIAMEEKR